MSFLFHRHETKTSLLLFYEQHERIRQMSSVAEKVKDIIVEKLGVERGAVVDTASFTNDLGADSLDTVELIMDLEKAFGITIPDEDAEKIKTVGDAISYVEAHAPQGA